MDTQRGFDEDRDDVEALSDSGVTAPQVDEPAPAEIGTDERRMHVRAYNHWVSLLRGRAYQSIEDLDPADIDRESYEELRADSGVTVQERAPMTAVAKLVFGADYDKARLTEFAAVLAHARRHAFPAGQLTQVLETVEGGIKAVVAAERSARNPAKAEARDPLADIAERLVLAGIEFATGLEPGELVVLIGRT